jgi:hypothetical protein
MSPTVKVVEMKRRKALLNTSEETTLRGYRFQKNEDGKGWED